ncbi:hypothetical protein SAMN02990966_05670 [Rhodospirillales bacterium URHD0017]|nr:hypothetical protein SAMN02990966_05670 [Rhodospirillales bacterium URHD0017]
MARSSRGPRPATTWAAEQNSRPLPRIVRLGRPANDNVRQLRPLMLALYGAFATAVGLFALIHWQVI